MPVTLDRASESGSRFATTRWDVVFASADTQVAGADEALSDLCSTYWRPLYVFVRRRGYSADDAEDLVQGFFAQFLRTQAVKKADPHRGRFRTFLLRSINNFLANEWDRGSAAKRGGNFIFVPLDELMVEQRNATDVTEPEALTALFDRSWAQAVVDATLRRLRNEAEAQGKGAVFAELKLFLTTESASYETVAAKLKLPLAAVKTAIHRLRANFRTSIRREVARTVSSPTEIDDELRYLRTILASGNSDSSMAH